MATIKKVKKYQNAPKPIKPSKPLSDKDSMNIYANRYDQYGAEAAKALGEGKGKEATKLVKKRNEARANENRLSKKIGLKKGGKVSKAQTGKELPKTKKEFSELRKKQDSENSTIQKSLKSTFDNVNKNRYSKSSMKTGGKISKKK
jgi:seryl-tRNA synthetase